MDTMLTFKEKKYAQKLITNSKNLDAAMWPEWGACGVCQRSCRTSTSRCFFVMFGIKLYLLYVLPVSCFARPACWMALLRLSIKPISFT